MNCVKIESGLVIAHKIYNNLWMGNAPPIQSVYGSKPLGANFDTLVLCAAEYQPEKSLFQIEKVIHAPMYDLMIMGIHSSAYGTSFSKTKKHSNKNSN